MYCITNNVNGKKYIGQSVDIKSRFRRHKASRLHEVNNQSCRAIQRAFQKYGIDNFTFEVLFYSDNREYLNYMETKIIEGYSTVVPNGYNLNNGGDYRTPSEETRQKRLGRTPWNKGMKFVITEEQREAKRQHMIALNKSRAGIPRTEEQKRAHSEKMKGKPSPRKGVTVSEESRKKMSDSKKGRYLAHLWTPEVVAKRSAKREAMMQARLNNKNIIEI
jgi:hypothetical protein